MDRLEHELRVLRNESTSEISALITEGNALRVENAAVKANLTALKVGTAIVVLISFYSHRKVLTDQHITGYLRNHLME